MLQNPARRLMFSALLVAALTACGSQPALVDDGHWRLDPAPEAASKAGVLQVKEVQRASLIDQYPVALIARMKAPTTLHAKDIQIRRGDTVVQCAGFYVQGQQRASVDLPVGESEVFVVFDADPLPRSAVDGAHQATVLELGGATPGSMTLLSATNSPRWRPRVADIVGMQVDWGQTRLDGVEVLTTTRLALTAQMQYGQWFAESGLGIGFGALATEAGSISYNEVYPTITLGHALTAGRAVVTPILKTHLGYGCPRDECSLSLGEWGGGLRLGMMPTATHPAVQNTRPPVELTLFAGQAIVGRADGWALRFGLRVRPFANF